MLQPPAKETTLLEYNAGSMMVVLLLGAVVMAGAALAFALISGDGTRLRSGSTGRSMPEVPAGLSVARAESPVEGELS